MEAVPNHPKCFVDGLLDHQRRSEEQGADMRLTDPEIFGLTQDLLLAGRYSSNGG